jgi:hypothetical protein
MNNIRLNSSLDIVARKTNKTKLLVIKDTWDQSNRKKQRVSTAPSHSCQDTNHSIAAISDKKACPPTDVTGSDSATFEKLLRHILQPQSSTINKVIAVTLHESSHNEFPCWDEDDDNNCHESINDTKSIQVCFFLGAVRDMYKDENRKLRQVCNQYQIPVLRIRFGPVSEFTSKILSVVAYHLMHHRLVLGCQWSMTSVQRGVMKNSESKATTLTVPIPSKPIILHFICQVPITTDVVTSNLRHRNRILWCLVRCTVTCLWRSRLAGAESHRDVTTASNTVVHVFPPPINRVSFLFNDGIVMTFDQNDFVTGMAEQHCSAPSEYQILSAIRSQLDAALHDTSTTKLSAMDALQPSTLHHSLFHDAKANCVRCPCIHIDFTAKKCNTESCYFYSAIDNDVSVDKGKSESLSHVIAIIVPVHSDPDVATTNQDTLKSTIQQAIVLACSYKRQKGFIHVSGHRLVQIDDCIDQEGATITMIQHLAYQGRLVNLCHQVAHGM